jgi:drug/metabolite transporter (DMT)-like permease
MQTGVLFLVLAMLLTPAVDGVAKTLATDHTAMEVAFLRYFTAGLIAVALAKLSGRRIVVHREDRLGMVFRTALIMGAMTSLIAALAMVPMAKAVGGFLIAPIVSGFISVVIYREAVTVPRLVGSALSVAGAYVLMAPEAGIELGSIFALAGGALLGAYLSATRGARASDALSTLAVQCLLGSAMLAPFAFWNGLPAFSFDLLIGALALGGISAVCHFLTVAAYSRAEATTLAPFLYFNMISAMAVGFFFFGESLSGGSLAALGAIAFGGLVTLIKGDLGLGLVLRAVRRGVQGPALAAAPAPAAPVRPAAAVTAIPAAGSVRTGVVGARNVRTGARPAPALVAGWSRGARPCAARAGGSPSEGSLAAILCGLLALGRRVSLAAPILAGPRGTPGWVPATA